MTKFTWKESKKPLYILAPMANITTLPFRSICKKMGADVVFTPMISSNAIVHNEEKTLKIAEFLSEEQPVIVQIFGYSGELIANAAKIVDQKINPAGIDINLGCPAPKITGNECGSALLKNYNKALEIVNTVRNEFDGQLSVKLRLGWDRFDILPFVKELENIGIDAISLHGRTAKQGYTGKADWEAIAEVVNNTNLPVIGNGDIETWQEAMERTKITPAGVMLGRGTLGNPWIFKEIKEQKDIEVTLADRVNVIQEQAKSYIKYIGEERAISELRKHLGWYIKVFPGSQNIRKDAMLIKSKDELDYILERLKNLSSS